jgi:adenylate kinase
VFDGFPRTVGSSAVSGRVVEAAAWLPAAVLNSPGDRYRPILRRITGLRLCKTGGEIYNLFERPPRVEGRCDNDGGELLQRPDDREEIVAPRLRAYEKQTSPLVAYYRRLGLLHDVDASKSVEDVE